MKLVSKFQDEDFNIGDVVDCKFLASNTIILEAKAKKGGIHTFFYSDIKQFRNDWEDYEKPKSGIKDVWSPDVIEGRNNVVISCETKEEAEKAVEKLKAWKRLKDKGFEFEWIDKDTGSIKFAFFNREGKITKEMWQDLDICFGGEE